MSAHTPGPWDIVGDRRPLEDFQVGNLSRAVCSAWVLATGDVDETKANARLIAAAPELLDELENCVDLLTLAFPDVPVDSCIGVALIKARAAIAKATGAAA